MPELMTKHMGAGFAAKYAATTDPSERMKLENQLFTRMRQDHQRGGGTTDGGGAERLDLEDPNHPDNINDFVPGDFADSKSFRRSTSRSPGSAAPCLLVEFVSGRNATFGTGARFMNDATKAQMFRDSIADLRSKLSQRFTKLLEALSNTLNE